MYSFLFITKAKKDNGIIKIGWLLRNLYGFFGKPRVLQSNRILDLTLNHTQSLSDKKKIR